MVEPTVFIVDDDDDMRDSLRWLLKTVGLRAETFASAEDFLAAFAPESPGCLVFDVRMPGTSGLDLHERLVAKGVTLPVIFITAFADVPMAVRAMRSGAVEFLEKPLNRQTLLDKIQKAIREDAERRRIQAAREAAKARFLSLTDKEKQVLQMVKDGLPNKAIAGALEISPRAVEMRRSNLMKKLGARSLVELVRMTIALDEAD